MINPVVPACLALVLLTSGVARGEDAERKLARRPYLGARLEAVEGSGVVVRAVVPGSSAAAGGVREGDVLLTANGTALHSPGDLVQLVSGLRAGDEVALRLRRAGEAEDLAVALTPRPTETVAGGEVLLGSVVVEGARLRTIVTQPIGPGPHPAVLFVQGLGCASYDFWYSSANPVKRLLDGWTEAGYATMRVEKSGLGDSEGPPCSEIDFETELAGYRAGLADLRGRDFVDPARVHVFGHSMGGVMAPYLATSPGVAGIMVYGTVARTWPEYMLENFRRQDVLEGKTPAQIDELQHRRLEFQYRLLVERKTPAEVLAAAPHLKGLHEAEIAEGAHYFGRHASFFHQLHERNLPAAWSKVKAPVLAIHGEYDWVSSAADHDLIARAVDPGGSGRGRAIVLPGMDHGFLIHASLRKSYEERREGTFGQAIIQETVRWMKGVAPERG